MKILGAFNNKGGVKKTTIAYLTAIYLGKKGKKIGFIDLDHQTNSSSFFEFEMKNDLKNILMTKKKITRSDFSPTQFKNVEILSNKKDLFATTFMAIDPANAVFLLKDALNELNEFDYVITDSHPSLDIDGMNILAASNYLIIPVIHDEDTIDGMNEVIKNYKFIKERFNPQLEVSVLRTYVDTRTLMYKTYDKQLIDLLKAENIHLFNSMIRRNENFRQARSMKMDIISYEGDKNKNGTKDIKKYISELLNTPIFTS